MRARRTDGNHAAVLEAIRRLGYPCMSLHAHGKGLEDILVAADRRNGSTVDRFWVLVEVKKVERESTGYYRHTPAQKEWYAMTNGWPRLVVTSPLDAIDKLSELTR